jgi:hypothetical protein
LSEVDKVIVRREGVREKMKKKLPVKAWKAESEVKARPTAGKSEPVKTTLLLV